MIKNIIGALFLALSLSAYGQVDQSLFEDSFQEKGLRLVSNTELSQNQLDIILSFNFEEYRKSNSSLIIKVVDGPHLELFSSNFMEFGIPDQVEDQEDEHQSNEHESELEHIAPSDRKIKKFEVQIVDVFKINSTNETH
ncbi:MAG: hypothetical protein QNK23_13865 [Crocinitomicaceae bacterium]|nr:hypothetical protein [Crocinitomicaceae bacterium]